MGKLSKDEIRETDVLSQDRCLFQFFRTSKRPTNEMLLNRFYTEIDDGWPEDEKNFANWSEKPDLNTMIGALRELHKELSQMQNENKKSVNIITQHFIELIKDIKTNKATPESIKLSAASLDQKLKPFVVPKPLKIAVCVALGAFAGFVVGFAIGALVTGGVGGFVGAVIGALKGAVMWPLVVAGASTLFGSIAAGKAAQTNSLTIAKLGGKLELPQGNGNNTLLKTKTDAVYQALTPKKS